MRYIDDKQHGGIEQPRNLCCASSIACMLSSIKETHDALNNGDVCIAHARIETLAHHCLTAEPRIQVVGWACCSGAMIGGINVVRPNLIALYPQTLCPQGGHQTGSDGC